MSLFPRILQSLRGKISFQEQDDGFVSICETEEVHGPKPEIQNSRARFQLKNSLSTYSQSNTLFD